MSAVAQQTSFYPPPPRRKEPLAPHEIEWRRVMDEERGFYMLPRSTDRVVDAITPVQLKLFWHVVKSTIGAPTNGMKPADVALTEDHAARMINSSRNGAANALKALVEMGILSASDDKRAKRYGLAMANWRNVKARPQIKLAPRVAEADDDDEEESADAPSSAKVAAETLVILKGETKAKARPLSGVCPHAADCKLSDSSGGRSAGERSASQSVTAPVCTLQLANENASSATTANSNGPSPTPEQMAKAAKTFATIINNLAVSAAFNDLPKGQARWDITDAVSLSQPLSLTGGTLTVGIDYPDAHTARFAQPNIAPTLQRLAAAEGVKRIVFVERAPSPPSEQAEAEITSSASTLRAALGKAAKIASPLPPDTWERAQAALRTPDELFLDVVRERAARGTITWKLLPKLAADATRANLDRLGLTAT